MVGQPPHKLKNLFRLRDAERRGRLVENDELRVPHDRFRHRDRLALAARERRDGLADRTERGDAEARQRFGCGPLHVVLVEQAAAQPLAPEEHVLHDVEIVAEREVLIDDLDAEGGRVRADRGS